jgi:hypothetical protein
MKMYDHHSLVNTPTPWYLIISYMFTNMTTVRNMTYERHYCNFLYRCLKFFVVTSMNIMQRLLKSYFEVTRPKGIGHVILIFNFRFIGDKSNEALDIL